MEASAKWEGEGGAGERSLRDPERESVYRAFREHERHRGTRREGRVVIDRPDCVAHEPLKVPYKYGPVSVRRLCLSSSCRRLCVCTYVTIAHILALCTCHIYTHTHTRVYMANGHKQASKQARMHARVSPTTRRAAVEKARSVARRNERGRKNATTGPEHYGEGRAFACLLACLPASTCTFFR